MPHLLPLPIRFTRDADGRTGRSTALTTAKEVKEFAEQRIKQPNVAYSELKQRGSHA